MENNLQKGVSLCLAIHRYTHCDLFLFQRLFQSPLTTSFWPFLPKVLSEAKRQKIVTV
jgi:hypothetical protein